MRQTLKTFPPDVAGTPQSPCRAMAPSPSLGSTVDEHLPPPLSMGGWRSTRGGSRWFCVVLGMTIGRHRRPGSSLQTPGQIILAGESHGCMIFDKSKTGARLAKFGALKL